MSQVESCQGLRQCPEMENPGLATAVARS